MHTPVRLEIKVVPGASKTEISGWLGERLKVRVSAPPEKGKANQAVEHEISRVLGLPVNSVQLVSGGRSPRKTLEIRGMTRAEVFKRLAKQ
jgi:uncharacterized protein (TIGR00251 family)